MNMASELTVERRRRHGDEMMVPALPPPMFRVLATDGHIDRLPSQPPPRRLVPAVMRRRQSDAKRNG